MPWDIGRIVSRPRRKPYVPVFGCRNLRRIGLISTDEASEQLARLRGVNHRQQEMPHHRHSVTTENEPLNVREVECRFCLVVASAEQTAKDSHAFFRL